MCLLDIDNKNLFKQEYIASQINPYIKRGKARLIEPPSPELKKVQRKLKRLLYLIEYPNNVFSGVPKRSYAQNAQFHANTTIKSMFKIDLSGFFLRFPEKGCIISFQKNYVVLQMLLRYSRI